MAKLCCDSALRVGSLDGMANLEWIRGTAPRLREKLAGSLSSSAMGAMADCGVDTPTIGE